jgi:hypothetical protein
MIIKHIKTDNVKIKHLIDIYLNAKSLKQKTVELILLDRNALVFKEGK